MNKILTALKRKLTLQNDNYKIDNYSSLTHKSCYSCNGTGFEDIFNDCDICNGTGIVRKSYKEYVQSLD
ncbi:hypothetical protein M4D71_00725 [Niallia taxi]|uniref:hypothetical protein n=1 Tax=Niallia taxi TaxID=2499688 RepID=UPI0021A5EB05|nr:hypothetical protein [Niallia taxi]MCT2342643.1 hypothetical protein [Niallia taxi]